MIPCCYSCIDKDYLIYFNWFLFTLSSMPYSLCPVLLDHESDASPALSGLVSNISFDDAPRLNLVILYTEATLLVHFCFL